MSSIERAVQEVIRVQAIIEAMKLSIPLKHLREVIWAGFKIPLFHPRYPCWLFLYFFERESFLSQARAFH